jgi:hypothetical protein
VNDRADEGEGITGIIAIILVAGALLTMAIA